MIATELLADLTRLGIRLEAHGDRLRFWPRSAVTPELADRMKAHKAELLAVLQPQATQMRRAPTPEKPLEPTSVSRPCPNHLDVADRVDTPAEGRPGWIRTTCRRCGKFIGYRPAV